MLQNNYCEKQTRTGDHRIVRRQKLSVVGEWGYFYLNNKKEKPNLRGFYSICCSSNATCPFYITDHCKIKLEISLSWEKRSSLTKGQFWNFFCLYFCGGFRLKLLYEEECIFPVYSNRNQLLKTVNLGAMVGLEIQDAEVASSIIELRECLHMRQVWRSEIVSVLRLYIYYFT